MILGNYPMVSILKVPLCIVVGFTVLMYVSYSPKKVNILHRIMIYQQ